MDEEKKRAVQSWLLKAQRDLTSAERLAEGEEPLLDTAICHCQQTAEKAIKGFLVSQERPFRKTHDLAVLLIEASKLTSDFKPLDDAADRLTSYVTLFRYPGDVMEPAQAEYEQAYQDASQFLAITLALIPAEAHPAP